MEEKGPVRWPDLLGARMQGLLGCLSQGITVLPGRFAASGPISRKTAALFTPCPLGGACEKGPQNSTKSKEQWSSRETFFLKQRTFWETESPGDSM